MMGGVLLVLANMLLVLAPLLVSLAGGSTLLAAGAVAAALVPVGPSLVAAAYAFNRLLAGRETGAFRDFVHGYRANVRQALAVWLPYLAVLAVVVLNLLLLPGTFDAGNPGLAAARAGAAG
jgi:hypothetical protein